MLTYVGELCVVAIMVGLVMGVTHLGATSTIIIIALVAIGSIATNRPKWKSTHPTRLSGSFLLCLLVLAGSMQGRLTNFSMGWLFWVPGSVLSLVGLIRLVKSNKTSKETMSYVFEWLFAATVTFAACLIAALVARMVLTHRSTTPIVPGRLSFLQVMLMIGLCWFGLVVHLKSFGSSRFSTLRTWLWDRRHLGAVLIVVGAAWARSLCQG